MNMDILNQHKIDQLATEIGSDNVPLLLDIFLGEMATYRENLQSYTGEKQLSCLKEISHALKSSAASFGADRLCELAISIDKKAKNHQLIEDGDEASAMVDLLGDTSDVYRSYSK